MRAFTLIFLFISMYVQAQTKKYDFTQWMKDGKISITTATAAVVVDDNKTSLLLNAEKGGNGYAWLTAETFSNGTIELDMKGNHVSMQSFLGVAFHGVDESTHDLIYFRPFNFRSPDSVRRIHAVQYTSGPNYGWERLRTEHNGQYEKAIILPPNPDEWFHAKIVVEAPHVSVYVNNNSKPSLVIDQLQYRGTGKIGLWLDGTSPAYFANLVVTSSK